MSREIKSRFHALCAEHKVMPLFLPPHSSNQLQSLDLSVFGLTKRLLIRVYRMEKLNIRTQHIGQVVRAFISAVVLLNIAKNLRNSEIDWFVDEDHFLCRAIPGLARFLLNQASLQSVPIPEKPENKIVEAEINLYLEECVEILYDFDAPDERQEKREPTNASIIMLCISDFVLEKTRA